MVCLSLLLAVVVAAAAEEAKELSLKQAQELAIQHHPRITIAELKALVARQDIVAARSGFLPQLSGNITAVGSSDNNTRIASSGLTTSSVEDRASAGVTLSQLIYDFGRTGNLTESSRLRARAEERNALATRAQLLVQVNSAYYAALHARSVLRVAEETAKTRQLILDQVKALADNKLKSELDVSFAEVNAQEAALLLVKTQNDLKASFATLAALLGSREQKEFRLVEEPLPPALATAEPELVIEAIRQRPELDRLRYERDAAQRFARAEGALRLPTINAIGSAGSIPFREGTLNEHYAAAGVTMTFPIFEGFQYSARKRQAALRAQQAEEALRDEEDNITREVRIAWLNVNNASQRLGITAKLLQHARKSFDLSQARYKVGASSIIELSQAQLSQTSAEIGQANARYDYLAQRSLLDYQVGRIK